MRAVGRSTVPTSRKNLQPDCLQTARTACKRRKCRCFVVGRQKGPDELRCLTCLCGVGGMCNSPRHAREEKSWFILHEFAVIHTQAQAKCSRLWSKVAIKSRAIWIFAKKINKVNKLQWFSRDTRASETLADLADRADRSLIFVMKAAATVCNIHVEPGNEVNINKDFDLTAASPLAPLWYSPVRSSVWNMRSSNPSFVLWVTKIENINNNKMKNRQYACAQKNRKPNQRKTATSSLISDLFLLILDGKNTLTLILENYLQSKPQSPRVWQGDNARPGVTG